MTSNLFDLSNKVALITGSSKGIGRAIAEEMARHGAKVVISSRKADICEEVAASINAELAEDASNSAGAAVAIPANISHKEELQRLVDATREKLGKIDILICNAAVNPYYGSMQDLPDEAFDKILGVNIKSNHWLVNMVLPEMRERKDGAKTALLLLYRVLVVCVVAPYLAHTAFPKQLICNWYETLQQSMVATMCG